MTKPNSLPLCLCGHTHKSHDTRRKAPGCKLCPCMAYKTFRPTPLHRGDQEELAHWSHHVGLPPDSKQMSTVELEAAYKREQQSQQPTIEQRRQVERDKNIAYLRLLLKLSTREMMEYQGKLDRALAEVSDVTR